LNLHNEFVMSLAESVVIILLALHIGFITLWTGAASILSMIILPSVGKLSPSSRAEFIIETVPRYARFIVANAIGAIIAGVLLFGYETRGSVGYAPSPLGTMIIEAGAGLGLIAFALAIGVAYPTANKLVRILKQASAADKQSNTADIPRLQGRMRMTAGATAGLLALTILLMVVGATV
jgi:hypothetical protein